MFGVVSLLLMLTKFLKWNVPSPPGGLLPICNVPSPGGLLFLSSQSSTSPMEKRNGFGAGEPSSGMKRRRDDPEEDESDGELQVEHTDTHTCTLHTCCHSNQVRLNNDYSSTCRLIFLHVWTVN